MSTSEIVLNIAVNLGRMARWAMEGKQKRIQRFIEDTNNYLEELDKAPKSQRFARTLAIFKDRYAVLIRDQRIDEVWAEEMLTWANILTHRARLA